MRFTTPALARHPSEGGEFEEDPGAGAPPLEGGEFEEDPGADAPPLRRRGI